MKLTWRHVIESITLLMIGTLMVRAIIVTGDDDERMECSYKWKVIVELMYRPMEC